MPYLTIFSLPKGFIEPHTTLIQRNALASWSHLGPDVEVILMGDDPGVAEAAAEFAVAHVGDSGEERVWNAPPGLGLPRSRRPRQRRAPLLRQR